jgi:hypothetical protein
MSRPAVVPPKISGLFVEEERSEFPASGPINIDLTGRPVIAAIYVVSGVILNVLGPLFWAAVTVLFLYAEMFT